MPKRGSCGSVLPGCRLSKQYPSINSPAARCCTSRARRDAHCTLLGSPVGRDPRRLVLASRLPSRAAPTCDPHSARCSAGCHTSRDFVPWRFLDAGQLSLRSVSSLPASKNQRISTLSDMAGPACVADSVGCKTAKRGRAGQKPSELYYTSRGIHYKLRSYWSCMAKCRIDLCLGNERGFASDWRTV
jgi:hypothetical protein